LTDGIYDRLDATHLPALISIITTLLRDRSPLSLGSVAVAFEAVCPTRLDLLHQHYRRLCKLLVDVDEWGQVDLANLLLRYARTMLPRPVVKDDYKGEEDMDKDVKLLLQSVEPLFQSRNPAVCGWLYIQVEISLLCWFVGGTSSDPGVLLRRHAAVSIKDRTPTPQTPECLQRSRECHPRIPPPPLPS
jgi:Adaptin N terminal region